MIRLPTGRRNQNTTVQCFTGTQIPGIEDRIFSRDVQQRQDDNLYPDGFKDIPAEQVGRY
jgi:hypothetical protein